MVLMSTPEFDPREVYQTLYKAFCIKALTKVYCSPTVALAYSSYIESSIDSQFQSIDCGFETAAQRHRNNLEENYHYWTPLKSHKTCFFCIRRPPETALSCEHAICEKCVRTFGSLCRVRETYFEIRKCIQCLAEGNTRVRIKPPTAGVRVLSIDGGGVRGVVPLEFLSLLQVEVGNDISLESLFDQAFGTSSGELDLTILLLSVC